MLSDHLYQHHTDISEVWRFYNDGKCWLFRYIKKTKIGSGIGIVINNQTDVENVIKLMELRIKIK